MSKHRIQVDEMALDSRLWQRGMDWSLYCVVRAVNQVDDLEGLHVMSEPVSVKYKQSTHLRIPEHKLLTNIPPSQNRSHDLRRRFMGIVAERPPGINILVTSYGRGLWGNEVLVQCQCSQRER